MNIYTYMLLRTKEIHKRAIYNNMHAYIFVCVWAYIYTYAYERDYIASVTPNFLSSFAMQKIIASCQSRSEC